jgi:hypothetical protein
VVLRERIREALKRQGSERNKFLKLRHQLTRKTEKQSSVVQPFRCGTSNPARFPGDKSSLTSALNSSTNIEELNAQQRLAGDATHQLLQKVRPIFTLSSPSTSCALSVWREGKDSAIWR